MMDPDLNDPRVKEAMAHVKSLLGFIGDDPEREGLLETPKRVVKAMHEHFQGYSMRPEDVLSKTFTEIEGYDQMVLLSDIDVHSHCEHHMVPFIGKAHVAYIPDGKVVGLSKLAKLVEIFSKRLQVQEKLTAQIANALEEHLKPRGVAVVVQADYATLVEHPLVVENVTKNVAARIARNVPKTSVLAPIQVLEWQYRTPQWRALPHGEIAKELGVDRLVYIDLYEYRLNPVGNSYIWDGVAGANIGVVEADSLSPDEFVFTANVVARFPNKEGIGRESARREDIERGLLTLFIQRSSWPFYRHIEDKYPEY